MTETAMRSFKSHGTDNRSPSRATSGTQWVIGLLAAVLIGGAQANTLAPDELVSQTTREVQSIMKQDPDLKAGKPQKVQELVEQKILPHFDFERMTMLAVGRDWSRASPDQQKALVAAFRALLVRTYSGALATYKDNKIEVKPVKAAAGDENSAVRRQVSIPGTGSVAMDYRMHRTPNGWKVHDVSVEGVSLVTTYRSTFKTELDGGIRWAHQDDCRQVECGRPRGLARSAGQDRLGRSARSSSTRR